MFADEQGVLIVKAMIDQASITVARRAEAYSYGELRSRRRQVTSKSWWVHQALASLNDSYSTQEHV